MHGNMESGELFIYIMENTKTSNTSRSGNKDWRNKSSKNRNQPGRQGAKQPNNKKKESTLDNRVFVKKAMALEDSKYETTLLIKDLPVNIKIKENLAAKGYIHPTEIQEKTITPILEGRNLMGLAQTGTGKTAAFLVPIVHQLVNTQPGFQVLIVVPTRELAVQIESELKTIAKGLNLYSQVFIGGTSVHRDLEKLRRPSHFIIGTPGRLLDMENQRALKFHNFTHLVLDEFDRLLDMGFSHDIQKMISKMTGRKQSVLFSATEEPNQKKLIGEILENPVNVRVSIKNTTGDHIEQETITVKDGENKMDVLVRMLKDDSFQKVIVFAETKRWVSKVCKELNRSGIKADEIHGNKSQNYRQNALNAFKDEKIKVLVATDVAARGLDIEEVSHVINYQKPMNFDSYIHRIGRTGRAGKSGKAYTFIN
jgi:ATP-dependent RNA helicase RhlE